jgi:acyl-CoA synthetase (NDP forming)
MVTMTSLLDQFSPIFYPKSIAVIGASANLYKWGNFLMAGIIKSGYKKPLYPINPKEETILTRKCYKSIFETPGPVDLAIITLPAKLAKQTVADCIEKGVKGIVLITSGFSEVGKEGKAIEAEIAAMIKKAGIRMIGPNTMGIINNHHELAFTASQVRPPRGHISVISQSGNLGDQVMQWAESMGIGISKFVGCGNEADTDVTDLIEYLHQDESTKVILLYFENVEDGRRLIETAAKVSMDKPIIALKGGRTSAGAKAAQSHTGSLAGDFPVTIGALQQAGVIIADNPTELIDFSVAFEHLPLPKGNRVGVITLGGGWGVIASDECNERGFELPDLPPGLVKQLDKMLPAYWSRANPIDLVGTFGSKIHKTALEGLAQSDDFDAILTLGSLGASRFIIRIVSTARDIQPSFDSSTMQLVIGEAARLEAQQMRAIGSVMSKYNKPILSVSTAEKLNYSIPIDDKMLVAYPTPEKAIRVFQAMLWYRNWKEKRKA